MKVAVVGGGFAGTVVGLELLNGPHAREHEVTVFEREPAAYTTLCAEGLSEATVRAFGAFDARPYVAQSFRGASWEFPGVRVEVLDRCHAMARERWIPAMAEAFRKAGGEYVTGEKVTAGKARELRERFDVLVGCDGPGSVVRDVVGGRHRTGLGIQYRMEARDYRTDFLEFFTDKRWSPEYAWVFPRGDILNVGILAEQDGSDWKRLDAFAASRGIEGKVVKREAYPIGFSGTRFGAGNACLVGDAAGLTNPLTKGGMAAAIHAARILAEVLAEGDAATAGDRYDARLRRHPLTDATFEEAEAILRAWSDEDFLRFTRWTPRVVQVGEGRSSARYFASAALAAAMNPRDLGKVRTLARAFRLSRKWSW